MEIHKIRESQGRVIIGFHYKEKSERGGGRELSSGDECEEHRGVCPVTMHKVGV